MAEALAFEVQTNTKKQWKDSVVNTQQNHLNSYYQKTTMSNHENNSKGQQIQLQQPPMNRYPPQISFQDLPLQALEKLRPRLTQLTHSLRTFNDSFIATPIPQPNLSNNATASIPNYSNLQNQFNVILSQLTSLVETLDQNKDILKGTNVYPNYEFNTTQFEGLLTTLLRKKHLPEVDGWIEESTKETESAINNDPNVSIGEIATKTKEELEKLREHLVEQDDEFSEFCFEKTQKNLSDFVFGGYLTKEEIEQGVKIEEVGGSSVKNDRGTTPERASVMSRADIYRFINQGMDANIAEVNQTLLI